LGTIAKNMNPKISVIIPVYNTEKYLSKCLDSIISQSFPDFECILVDDYSQDNSPRICDEYKKKDSRIIVIHKPKTEGASYARRTGIQAANAEYIQFIDSDDWIDSTMLETMYQNNINNDYSMVVCDFIKETENPDITIYEKQYIPVNSKEILIKNIFSSNYIHAVLWNKLIKKKLFDYIDWPSGSNATDRGVVIQLVYYIQDLALIKCVDVPLYHWVHNPVSSNNCPDEELQIKRIKTTYNNHLKLINFLREKYKDKMTIFEPELSTFTNWTKHVTMINKKTRSTKIFKEMYPRSNKHFFNSHFKLPFYHKLALFLASKNIIIQYYIYDFIQRIKNDRHI
jgi:glycosyltransferase involved in cell wall biosynthesis